MKMKKLLHLILSSSLYLNSPMPFSLAMAQEQSGFNVNNIASAVNGSIDAVGKMLLQSQANQHQFQMSIISAQNQTRVTVPQFLPAKYFPQCAITPAQMDYPEHACEKISNPIELQQAEILSKIGFDRTSLMTQMLSEAQNSSNPVGVKCLKDAKSKQLSAMEDKINNLRSINNNIKKNNQLFRDQNKALLESMKATNDELTGSQNSAKAASMNIKKLFEDPACNEVLSANAFGGGLRGVRDSMTVPTKSGKGLVDMAKNIARDESSIKDQIKMQTDRIVAALKNQGTAQGLNFLMQSNELARGGLTKFPAVAGAIKRKSDELGLTYQRISAELSKDFPGYKLPELDKHFSTNIENFSKDAGGYFKKKMIDDCVTMKDSTGLGLTRDQILSSLRQTSTHSSGTTTSSYKDRLNTILTSDAFISDKLNLIKALDEEYGKGNITIAMSTTSGRKNYTPYQMFQETVARCEARYTTDKTFSKNEANGSSQANKVAQAQKYIVELRDLEKNFSNNLVSEISDELVNCTGKAKERSGTCDTDRMDTNNENFCISSAVTCSNNIRSCFNRAESYVSDREAVLKNKASQYNLSVQSIVTQQEVFLKQIQARVFADAEFYKNFFPNSNWKMPDDLFVKLPELSSGAGQGLGNELVLAGGNQDFMDDLPTKIESLMQVLEDQKTKIAQTIDEYITSQKTAMENNKKTWSNVAETCLAAAKGYREQIAQAQAKATADNTEKENKTAEFCARYSDLAQSNPAPGCAGSNSPEALYTDSSKIAAYLDPSVQNNIKQFRNLCDEIQSEKTSKGGSKEKEPVEVDGLNELCAGSWDDAKSELLGSLFKNVPKDIADKREDISKFLDADKESKKLSDIVGSDAAQDNWGKAVTSLQGAIKRTKAQAGSTDICSYITDKVQSLYASRCHASATTNSNVTTTNSNATTTPTVLTAGEVEDQCIERLKAKDEFPTAELRSLNKAIKKINSSSSSADVMKRWSEIGERFGSACKAGSGNSLNNRFLGEFNKQIGSPSLYPSSFGGGMTQGL